MMVGNISIGFWQMSRSSQQEKEVGNWGWRVDLTDGQEGRRSFPGEEIAMQRHQGMKNNSPKVNTVLFWYIESWANHWTGSRLPHWTFSTTYQSGCTYYFHFADENNWSWMKSSFSMQGHTAGDRGGVLTPELRVWITVSSLTSEKEVGHGVDTNAGSLRLAHSDIMAGGHFVLSHDSGQQTALQKAPSIPCPEK